VATEPVGMLAVKAQGQSVFKNGAHIVSVCECAGTVVVLCAQDRPLVGRPILGHSRLSGRHL
jgi:hypothetical protein